MVSVLQAAVLLEAVVPLGAQTSAMTYRSILPTPYTARRLKYSIPAMSIVRNARVQAAQVEAAGRCAPTVKARDRYGRTPAFSPLRALAAAAAGWVPLSKTRVKNAAVPA